MAEKGYFFNSIEGDPREYDASDFANYFSKFIPTGVFNTGQGLYVSADGTSLNTTVGTGAAFIDGYMYENTEPKQLEHDIADPNYDRIDLVVIRLDNNYGVRNVFATVKQGTPSPNPTPPSLMDDGYIKELALAEVRIRAGQSTISQSQITDKRGNLVNTFGRTILESGTYANGSFVKFSDGTAECWISAKVQGDGGITYRYSEVLPIQLKESPIPAVLVTAYNNHNGKWVDAGTATTFGVVDPGSRLEVGVKFPDSRGVPTNAVVHINCFVKGWWE